MLPRLLCLLLFLLASAASAAPVLQDDAFDLPAGFHIYKVAEPELTGGSYDITFDGAGRLLVGDGKNVRRLDDSDGDQVYDTYAIIAEGLGGRGPQGLVVYGDMLYAVGGDGLQRFSGYQSGGPLKHEGRLGAPFQTGGDHAAHTILRGLDDYLYLVSGDGGGIGGRKHITEETSPVLNERDASVFRVDPTGQQWECVGSGGRNPPSLGMNYLGEFFSFDSDMEWHVDLPFYRPVRFNHWATGGDQGWQSVGAYPKYYLDCLPGVLDVGRGSPDWGQFYEHTAFPAAYRDAFLVCDYQWKSATSGGYANPGRVVAFHLERSAATWKAEMTVLAQPKRESGIGFGVVDVEVAPDGSLMISDHNQGVWRLFYDPDSDPTPPAMVSAVPSHEPSIEALLTLPQPMAEWSRVAQENMLEEGGEELTQALNVWIQDPAKPLRQRLRALRLRAPAFRDLESTLIAGLIQDPKPEMRGQATWLVGLRQRAEEIPWVVGLLEDPAPFVRRRAAECFTRFSDPRAVPGLVARLSEPDRFVRYAAMTALSHRPTDELVALMQESREPAALMRLLVATHLRRDRPESADVCRLVERLLDSEPTPLDLLRMLGLFEEEVSKEEALATRVNDYLIQGYPETDRDIRWEKGRLLGDYGVAEGFTLLLKELERETDGVTQFHLADCLSRISAGWTPEESQRLVRWLVSTQTGWFAEVEGKGRQFPSFWGAVLTRLGSLHGEAFMAEANQFVSGSQLADVGFKVIQKTPGADQVVLRALENTSGLAETQRLLGVLEGMPTPAVVDALLGRLDAATDRGQRDAFVAALAAHELPAKRSALFLQEILFVEDKRAISRCAERLRADAFTFEEYEFRKDLQLGQWTGEQAVAFRLLELMGQHPDMVASLEGALAAVVSHTRPSHQPKLQVIWTSAEQNNDERAWFTRSFRLEGAPVSGKLLLTCDNEFEAYLNGERVAAGKNWERPQNVDVCSKLRKGENRFCIAGLNHGGPAGLALDLAWETSTRSGRLVTDTTWKASPVEPPKGWLTQGEAVGNWLACNDVSKSTDNVMTIMKNRLGKEPLTQPEAIQEYWQLWYRNRYGQPFAPRVTPGDVLDDAVLHSLIVGMKDYSGDLARGRQVYLEASCFACHGGVDDQSSAVFGPALAGVTKRLNASELADALVYPSRQVAERFKAQEVLTNDGRTLSGFLTEQSEDFVAITDLQNQVTRLPRSAVKEIKAQESSLMPAKLLNRFSREDIAHLMAFLDQMK
ncbi:MAG: putative heme-binding domain-containing protein [Verrucomicrobiales bacterium]|jgi:putative heme-binding domain-containing protein